MARTKKEKSKNVVAFETAKDALEKASTAHEKQATDTNKRALEGAQKRYTEAKEAVKRERFLSVTVVRAKKVLAGVKNLRKGFASATYSYKKEEAGELVDAIQAAAKALQDHVSEVLSGKQQAATVETKFSFEL